MRWVVSGQSPIRDPGHYKNDARWLILVTESQRSVDCRSLLPLIVKGRSDDSFIA